MIPLGGDAAGMMSTLLDSTFWLFLGAVGAVAVFVDLRKNRSRTP